MADIAICIITEEAIRAAWCAAGRGEPSPAQLQALRGRATLIEGAMEDAGLGMASMLLEG